MLRSSGYSDCRSRFRRVPGDVRFWQVPPSSPGILRVACAQALGAGCQHCGAEAKQLHHFHKKRNKKHWTPSQVWSHAGTCKSDAERIWSRVHEATVALCEPCHHFLETFQGRTRARALPFALRWTDAGRGWVRAGACTCERCS